MIILAAVLLSAVFHYGKFSAIYCFLLLFTLSMTKSFMGQDIEISNLDILGETLGRENCFGAIKGHVTKGPLTYFRISTDDTKGKIKSYLGQGKFTDDEFNMDGGIAVCKIPNLQRLMKHLCQEGFEHHVAMVRGVWVDIVEEAVTKYLNWDLYHHDES